MRVSFAAGFVLAALLGAANQMAWAAAFTSIYDFPTDEGGPNSLVLGPGGVLYGTTNLGGTSNAGRVYSLTPPSAPGGPWTAATIWSFEFGTDSGGEISFFNDGVLYGFAQPGGANGDGAVFFLSPPSSPGAAWTRTFIWNFSGPDGAAPNSLVLGPQGVLYGTTNVGGSAGGGVVFSLTPPASPGDAWTENVVWSFASAPDDGRLPSTPVVFDSSGTLYGTTFEGGPKNGGTVYSLAPPSSSGGSWTEAILRSFRPKASGGPGGVILGPGGVLYGTTVDNRNLKNGVPGGSIFSLSPRAASRSRASATT